MIIERLSKTLTSAQSGANNGFHEAIGDTAALSVISLKHLRKLKILKSGNTTAEVERSMVITACSYLIEKCTNSAGKTSVQYSQINCRYFLYLQFEVSKLGT